MKIIKAGFEIMRPQKLDDASRDAIYGAIEAAARRCYKSESAVCEGSAEKICRRLIERGHEAMLEHASMTVCFFVDRGVTHEIVRHRLASYAQESTRYGAGLFCWAWLSCGAQLAPRMRLRRTDHP